MSQVRRTNTINIGIKHFLIPCADPENFVRGGPTLITFFFVDEGREDQNTIKSGPLSARQRNTIYLNGVLLAGL